MIDIKKTLEFENWYKSLRDKEQSQIDARIERIKNTEHFGDAKYLGDNLAELRWRNGFRVYFFKVSLTEIILLIGGIKNAQQKDISKARILLRKYADF